jgi:hypothetical protein
MILHEINIPLLLRILTKGNFRIELTGSGFRCLTAFRRSRVGGCFVCLFCMFKHNSLQVRAINAEPDASWQVISVHVDTLFMTRPAIFTFSDTRVSTESRDIVNLLSTVLFRNFDGTQIGCPTFINQKTRQRTFNGSAPKQKVEKWTRYLGTGFKYIQKIFWKLFLIYNLHIPH